LTLTESEEARDEHELEYDVPEDVEIVFEELFAGVQDRV
jgi:hypothetical protein